MIGDISSRSVDDRLRADTINNIQQRGTIKKRIAANGRESYKLHFATCVSFVPEPIRYSWQVVGIVSRAVLVVRAVVYQLNIESSFCCTAVVVEPDLITMSFHSVRIFNGEWTHHHHHYYYAVNIQFEYYLIGRRWMEKERKRREGGRDSTR